MGLSTEEQEAFDANTAREQKDRDALAAIEEDERATERDAKREEQTIGPDDVATVSAAELIG